METKVEQAVRHVTSGEKIVATQKRLLVKMTEQRLDTRAAIELLDMFEQTQAIFQSDLQVLRANDC